MTSMTIGSLTATEQKADVAAPKGPTAEQKQAARDFEAIFMRQLLAPMEKSSGLSGGESSGGSVFRSMLVGALADTAAQGGGIGMSELILKAMLPSAPQGKPDLSHQDHPDPIAQMGALHSGVGPARSTRLGVTSRVLTQARGAPILVEPQSTATAPLSEGDAR